MSERLVSIAVLAATMMTACERPAERLGVEASQVVLAVGTPVVDLRADVNRNGTIDFELETEDANEEKWDATHGAIMLANIDDDSGRCRVTDDAGRPLPDRLLSDCNDAADAVVNGAEDAADLAPMAIQAWPSAPAGTVTRLILDEKVASKVRLFRRAAESFRVIDPDVPLDLADLRSGVTMGVEALDIARDLTWDGFVDVTLQVVVPDQPVWKPGTYTDTVRLRVAPVLLFHHQLPVETAFVTETSDPLSTQFTSALAAGVAAADPNMKLVRLTDEVSGDIWTQDFFESGYASMPGPNGAQRVMRVFLRDAFVAYLGNGQAWNPAFPLRKASRIVFSRFRAKDTAGVQQVDDWSQPTGVTENLNGLGNLETIPPFTHNGKSWPLGRLIRGSVSGFSPDPTFAEMTEAQRYQVPSVDVDTSWLGVGHIDETVSFIKANTPRGWILLLNDPRLAKQMLEAEVARGNGNVPMFVGKKWWPEDEASVGPSAETTISQLLANAEVMQASATAAVKVDAQLDIIKRETGLTDAEIVKVPFLHYDFMGSSVAYQPGTVNLFVLNDTMLVAPDPHGPVIGGRDIFKKQIEDALMPYGYSIRFIDNWENYHLSSGEVHCGTNATRAIPSVKWWEVTP
jgi:protein-arginine deiminase